MSPLTSSLILVLIACLSSNAVHDRSKRQSGGDFAPGAGFPPRRTGFFPPRRPGFFPPRRPVFFPSESFEPAEEEADRCVTPLNRPGSCIPVTLCVPLRRTRNFDFLRRSICGYDNVEPKVCCPISRPDDSFDRPFTRPRPPITPPFRPDREETTRPPFFPTRPSRPEQPEREGTVPTRPPRPVVTEPPRPVPPVIQPTPRPPQPETPPPRIIPPATPSPTPSPSTPSPPPSTSTIQAPLISTATPDGTNGNAIAPRKPSNLPKECGITPNVTNIRIVGGQEAALGAWPWMAALIIERNGLKSVSCGGALVTDRHVITASHCVVSRGSPLPPSRITVRLGDHNIHRTDDGANPVEVPVQQIIRHPDFAISTFKNDIAILKLAEPVKFTRQIVPVCLPYDEFWNEDLTDRNAFATGWGSTSFNGPSSSVLREVQLPIWEQKPCADAFKNDLSITDVYMCAGFGDGSKDACQGDSGGPLVMPSVKTRPIKFYLIGVTSFGKRCATVGYPGVYARVTKFLDWIRENMV